MIDILQSSALAKRDKIFSSIKKFIDQCDLMFIYYLLLLINRYKLNKSKHLIHNLHINSNNSSHRFTKLTKALFNLLIFTNRKNSFIN